MCHIFRGTIWKEVRPIPNGPILLDVNPQESLDGGWNLCWGNPRPDFVPVKLQH